MKKNWIVAEGTLSRMGIPDEIIVNNYFGSNRVIEFAGLENLQKQH